MTVRRTTVSGLIGYGVVGGGFGNPTEPIVLNMRDISNEIPLPQPDPLDFDPSPYVAHAIYLQWRFSVSIGIADMEFIKRYDLSLGKSQFGKFVTSAFGYVTDEGFISYAKIKSKLYYCRVLFLDGDRFDGEPCDEPQVSEFPPGQDVGAWFPSSLYYGMFAEDTLRAIQPLGDCLAESVIISVPDVISALNVGLTYEYQITPYNAERYQSENFPRVMYL